MAGKEATVYILDLGRSMGDARGGREVSDLEWAMEYVWDRITTTVSLSVVAWFVGIGLICRG
jgi:ATP-dependent DNA helicase 2 subunit 2